MLYISRRVFRVDTVNGKPQGVRCYGVADTDDGVEEIVTSKDLEYIDKTYGFDIKGVPQDYTWGTDAKPYQQLDGMLPVQAKAKVLSHISVTTYRGVVVDVTWELVEKELSIRLSDFGDTLGDFIIYGNYNTKYPVTLIFDDKLKPLTGRPLRTDTALSPDDSDVKIMSRIGGWQNSGVQFDLRDVTNEELAYTIYEQVLAYKNAIGAVIDSTERKNRMKRKFPEPKDLDPKAFLMSLGIDPNRSAP